MEVEVSKCWRRVVEVVGLDEEEVMNRFWCWSCWSSSSSTFTSILLGFLLNILSIFLSGRRCSRAQETSGTQAAKIGEGGGCGRWLAAAEAALWPVAADFFGLRVLLLEREKRSVGFHSALKIRIVYEVFSFWFCPELAPRPHQ